MDRNLILKLLNDSLILSRVSISYCIDEAKPSDEVDNLKFGLEKITENLQKIIEIINLEK